MTNRYVNNINCDDDPIHILKKIQSYNNIIEKEKGLITYGTFRKTKIFKSNYNFVIVGTPNIKMRYFSDFFQFNIRKKCKRQYGMSIEQYINENYKILSDEVTKKGLTLSMCHIILEANRLAINVCDNFDITIAKYIYTYFKAKNVLDFCAGWGDRLIAAIALNIKYTGIDINTDLFIGYGSIIKTLTKTNNYTMINSPAEIVNIPDSNYDLIFTSPPYFSSEIYSEKKENINKYNSDITTWLNNFMIPSIKNAFNHLIINGYMVIGLNDSVGPNKTKINYTELLNLLIGTYIDGCLYMGTIGFRYPDKKYINPLWIWKKVNNSDPLFIKQKQNMLSELNKNYKLELAD